MPLQTPTPPAPAPTTATSPATATQMYNAALLMQRELQQQRERLSDQRRDVQNRMQGNTNAADLKGLEGQLATIDQRIADVEKQQAAADAKVAQAASVPGVIVPREVVHDNPPNEALVLGGFAIVVIFIGFPLALAYARRLWKRSSAPPPALPSDAAQRMENIERAIEAVAIEVERLGEGQRFVTQLLDTQARRQAERIEAPRN